MIDAGATTEGDRRGDAGQAFLIEARHRVVDRPIISGYRNDAMRIDTRGVSTCRVSCHGDLDARKREFLPSRLQPHRLRRARHAHIAARASLSRQRRISGKAGHVLSYPGSACWSGFSQQVIVF
jgi:hypothetical protein